MPPMKQRPVIAALLAGALLFAPGAVPVLADAESAVPKLKVGFIYVGPVADFGWTQSHNDGRLEAERSLPWLETSYVESVTEGDFENYADQMVNQGVKVIFATSTTFMDGSVAAAASHPGLMLMNASGFKHAPNLGTYEADPYQCFYLLGLMAGALSKTGKAGAVATYPTPDAVRYIDAFTIALRSINPKAVLVVRWLNSWYDPPASKEAAESLISEGVDFLISDTDSPTVVQVAGLHHIPVNGHTYDMHKSAPDDLISGDIVSWGKPYIAFFRKVRDGEFTPRNLQTVDEWWRLGDGAVEFGYQPGVPINPKYIDRLKAVQVDDGRGGKISVYDLVLKRLAEMAQPQPAFEPFQGPIADASGTLRIPAGRTATKAELFSISWRIPGVEGSWPNPSK
jgi:basic membrane protein A and related proteins